MTSDPGVLLIIISTVLAGLAVRRAGQAEAEGGGGAATAGTGVAIAGWLTAFMVLAFTVAVWAMTTTAGV
jgi:hypothetical protein